MLKWLRKFPTYVDNFFSKSLVQFDRLPQSIFSALLIAAILRVLSLSSVNNNSRFLLIFFISVVAIMIFMMVISRWKIQIDNVKEENRKVEREKEQLEKALGISFIYITNPVAVDKDGKKFYDPSDMYRKLQNYIREAKSVKLLDNVYSDLDDETKNEVEHNPKTQERKNWLALIKHKLDTEKDFVYQRIFYKYEPSVSTTENSRMLMSKAILNYVKGDTKKHITELTPIAKSRPANCSIKFLAHKRAMETFIIVDNKYLIFQVDGIDIDQSMPQDLLVMKNIEDSKEIITTYETRFEKLSSLAIPIETALTNVHADLKIDDN